MANIYILGSRASKWAVSEDKIKAIRDAFKPKSTPQKIADGQAMVTSVSDRKMPEKKPKQGPSFSIQERDLSPSASDMSHHTPLKRKQVASKRKNTKKFKGI